MPLVSKTFGDIITFTRASTATYFNATGTLQSAAIDAPRFDYDPDTLTARGFLIEEARTNSIRNNTMQGAVAGTPGTLPTNWLAVGSGIGTLTQEIVGVGVVKGISYIDIRLSGTTSTASYGYQPEQFTAIPAVSGQTWTGSMYLAIVGGSATNISNIQLNIVERNSSATNIGTTAQTLSLTSTLSRYSVSRTLDQGASTAYVSNTIIFGFASGVAIDITFRIGLPQLELGAFATSVIPTTSTALTRSADVASVNTLSPWYNATESTLYAEVLLANIPATSTFPTYASFNNGSVNELISLSSNSLANHRVTVRQGGSALWDVNAGGSIVVGTPSKWALAVASGSQAACANGGSVITNSTAGLPTAITTFTIGATAGGAGRSTAWIRRITYYPRKLSSAELQAITT